MYKIQLKYEGNNIDIKLNHRISVLSDDSGVGKTYLAKAIDSALKVKKYTTISATRNGENCDIDVIFEDTKSNDVEKILKKKNSIIIIDEADKIIGANKKIISQIQHNIDSCYLLILRGDPEGLVISPKQYLTFSRNSSSLTVEPYISKVNNFFKEE